jgi:hypothetical protein
LNSEECCEIGVESLVEKVKMRAQSSGKQGRIPLLLQAAVSIQDIWGVQLAILRCQTKNWAKRFSAID